MCDNNHKSPAGFIRQHNGITIIPFSWDKIDKTLTVSVLLPENTISIKNQAFEGCLKLQTVEIYCQNNIVILKEIGKNAFKNCKQLKRWYYPSKIIGERAFYGCTSLREIEMYCNFKQHQITNIINNFAFCKCTSLEYVKIDNIQLGDHVFDDTNVTLICQGVEFKSTDFSANQIFSKNFKEMYNYQVQEIQKLHEKHMQMEKLMNTNNTILVNLIHTLNETKNKECIDADTKCTRCILRNKKNINDNQVIVKPCGHMLCKQCLEEINTNYGKYGSKCCYQCQQEITKVNYI